MRIALFTALLLTVAACVGQKNEYEFGDGWTLHVAKVEDHAHSTSYCVFLLGCVSVPGTTHMFVFEKPDGTFVYPESSAVELGDADFF